MKIKRDNLYKIGCIIMILLIGLVTVAVCVSGVSTDNIVSYWNLDDSALAIDTLNRYNCTKVNTVVNISGIINNGVNFSGTGQYDCNTATTLVFGNVTMGGWIKSPNWNSGAYQNNIIGKKYASKTPFVLGNLDAVGVTGFGLYDGVAWRTSIITTALSTNTWVFLVGRYNGTHLAIYVNGTLNHSLAYTGGIPVDSGIIQLGNGGGTSIHQTDETFLFNRSLSNEEIMEIYTLNMAGVRYPYVIINVTNKINFISQTPSDLTAVSLFTYKNLSIVYNYNNSVNRSTVKLGLNITSNSLPCIEKVNNTCIILNNTLRYINQTSNTTSGSFINYTFNLYENDIYPSVNNLLGSYFYNTLHSNVTLNNDNSLVSIEYLGLSNLTQFNVFEIMATSNGNAKVYTCNSSYNFNSVVSTNINCIEIGAINKNDYNHNHTIYSAHNVIAFSILNGKIGNVSITPQMYFMIAGENAHTTSVSYINNLTNSSTTKTGSASGGAWTNQVYTIDAHIHQYGGAEYLNYYAIGNYDGTENSTIIRSELIDVTGFKPQPAIITKPFNTIQSTRFLNITYLNATPTLPSVTITNYSINLLNSDDTFNRTIKLNNVLLNYYNYDLYNENLTLGVYGVEVIAIDSLGGNSSDIEYFNLTRNALINITPYDSATKAYLNNITINLTNYNTSTIQTFSTTQNYIEVDIIKNNNYNVFFDVLNYAYDSINYTANTSSFQVINKSLTKTNSVDVYFYDEISGALIINTTCNLTMAGTYSSTLYNTTTGNILLTNLTEDTYTATGICTLYAQRQYSLTVTNRSTQTLNIYLTQSSTSVLFSFTDKDTGVVLEDVLVGLSKMINGSLTLVESRLTDVTGRTQFNVQTNTLYTFTNTKTGYTTKTFTLNPIIFTSYNVQLQKDSTIINPLDYQDVSVTYTPSNFILGNQTFIWTINSNSGALTDYGFSLTAPCKVILDTGVNAYGSTFSNNFYLNTTCGVFDTVRLFYYYELSDGTYRNFTIDLGVTTLGVNNSKTFINTLNSKTYGLGLFERVLITVIITLIIMGVVGMIGGIMSSLAVGLLILGYFTSVGFIPASVVIITLFVGFVMLASMNKQR